MCNPALWVSAIMTVVSTAYSTYTSKQSARRSELFAKRAAEEQKRQNYTKASIRAEELAQRARRERGRLRALSAESGLSGITSESILNNVNMQLGTDLARLELGADFAEINANYGLQNNLNQIEQPDYIGAALNTGLNIYQYGYQTGAWGNSSTTPPPKQTPPQPKKGHGA